MFKRVQLMTVFRIIFILVILMANLFCAWTQEGLTKPDYIIDDKRIYLEAEGSYDGGSYGEALKWLDKARAARSQKVRWEIWTLKNSLKSAEVKAYGDNLQSISKILLEREDYESLEIINRYKKYYGFDRFDSSMKKLLAFIENHEDFPEADYLSGKIYQLEGEYDVAEGLYIKAYSRADILDVKDEKYDILYSLSEIAYIKKDNKKYEEYLVLIVSNDANYKNQSFVSSIKRTIKSKRGNSVEKFFKMYRADNYKLLNAYFALGEYYQEQGQFDRALTAASLGCLTGFTKIYDVIKKRSPNFIYVDLSSLLNEATLYPDIVDWGQENNVWKGFNDFAEYVYNSKYEVFATILYTILKDYSPEEYWRREADAMLRRMTPPEQSETPVVPLKVID